VTPAEVAAVEASLMSTRFLGCSYRAAPKLVSILTKVDAALRAEWQRAQLALPGGAATQTFEAWHGIRGVGGYRQAAGWHGRGLAVDLNYRRNGFNVQLEAYYQGFGVDAFYRGAGKPEGETEFIRSRLGVVRRAAAVIKYWRNIMFGELHWHFTQE
jgi:hypothetical protein